MQIIDGKKLAEKFKDEIVQEIYKVGQRPNLAIVLVGDREDSKLYVDLKEREAVKVGIDTHLYKCDDDTPQDELIKTIKFLNSDDSIDAILIQLPLPDGYDTDKVIAAMDPHKDVDGFHPENLAKFSTASDFTHFIPPVVRVVIEMLNSIKCDLDGKKVCAVVNGDIFGETLTRVLQKFGAAVTAVRVDDKELYNKTNEADILITAIGKPKFITKEMIKDDAIVIDIGISKQDGKTVGDVDFEDVKDKVSFITPVPGGVGPMTIAMAFLNTLELFKKHRKI